MLINVTGCTAEEALDALGLIDNVEASLVVEAAEDLTAFQALPKSGTKRQAYLLYFAREGKGTRESARRALGTGSTYGGQEARVSELLKGGWLVENGEIEQTQAGGSTPVLVLTDKARQALSLATTAWYPLKIRTVVA